MAKKTIREIDVKDKKVIVRVDFNVPLKDGKITDDNRIVQALPTINYLKENGAKIILCSHLGKIKEENDKKNLSLAPVAKDLESKIGQEVTFVDQTRGKELEEAVGELKAGDILMFENTRFEDLDGKKESKNDSELGAYWAGLSDGIFVNDAFGTAHREHASNVGIAQNVETAVAGFLLEKEIEFIGGVVSNPKRPLVAILGGAKVSDKIGVIENLLNVADYVLIGGGMNYTFLKAKGYEIGMSLCEDDKIDLAKELLEKGKDKLVFPIDIVTAQEFDNEAEQTIVNFDNISKGYEGLDIGPKSIELFDSYIKDASTVVWNGPMGVFEMPNFALGTIGVCKSIANNTDATTIIGGGDSAAAAIQLGYAKDFTHISTGGGASLEYLEGKKLPGIICLDEK